MPAPYVPSRFAYVRRRSLAVRCGQVQIGGGHPLLIQTMCTTRTTEVEATVQQALRCIRAGAGLVRVTAPGLADAKALQAIRAGLDAAGCAAIPLCADIHFMPAAALEAVEHVEKVRVNPGNFADKKAFKVLEYTEQQYREELARVAERFAPLVRRAKALGRCLRIGANHGSLSDRIMNRYGDSPRGMVESALEFLAIAEAEGFRDLVISMKASNPKVMVQAYRLLCAELDARGTPYPLHLGVTEAGDGEDGRIKSAAGIGALLEDGIGDTIRVSLTEPPEAEIPVAQALAAHYAPWRERPAPAGLPAEEVDPLVYRRRPVGLSRLGPDLPVGGMLPPRVLAPASLRRAVAGQVEADARVADGALWGVMPGGLAGADRRSNPLRSPLPDGSMVDLLVLRAGEAVMPLPPGTLLLLRLDLDDPAAALRVSLAGVGEHVVVGLAECGLLGETRAYRLLAAVDAELAGRGGKRHAICLALPFLHDDLVIAAVAGGLLIDGIGDCLYLPAAKDPRRLGFTLLQAVKARQTRADYVACPSCGRTQFDLMEVTARIRQATGHLDSVTIAIMGCIVNGPGEMADADFGYVGSGPGKVDLYRGREKVRAGLPQAEACAGLITLIKESGRWKEPGR